MTWPITSIAEREQRLREGIATGLKFTFTPGRASNIGVIAAEVAGEIDDVHQHIAWQAKQRFTKTADLEGLKRIAAEFGLSRHDPVAASGAITITGTNGAELLAGTVWLHTGGQAYVTTETVTIADGTAIVAALAQEPGTQGNLAAGQTLSLSSPVAGIAGTAAVTTAFVDGREIEDIESFRARILFRQANPPMGGNGPDYVRWSTDIAGADGVWITQMAMGLGTVSVRIASYDANGWPIPSENLRQKVEDHIRGHINPVTGQWEGRPATAQVFVIIIAAKLIDLEFNSLSPSDSKTVKAVAANVQSLFRSKGEPGGTIRYSWLTGAATNAVGEDYHDLATPDGPIVCGVNELPVLNSIKVAGETVWERPV